MPHAPATCSIATPLPWVQPGVMSRHDISAPGEAASPRLPLWLYASHACCLVPLPVWPAVRPSPGRSTLAPEDRIAMGLALRDLQQERSNSPRQTSSLPAWWRICAAWCDMAILSACNWLRLLATRGIASPLSNSRHGRCVWKACRALLLVSEFSETAHGTPIDRLSRWRCGQSQLACPCAA